MGKRLKPATDKSLFVASRISGSVLRAVALTSASLAQDAGVSGIPPGAGEWVELQKPFLQCSAGAADPAAHNQARNTTDYRLATQSDAAAAGSGVNPCSHGANAILVVAGTPHGHQGERPTAQSRRHKHLPRMLRLQEDEMLLQVPRLFLEETATDKVHS